MDQQWLLKQGFHPHDVNTAYVSGMGLRIGNKATLVPAAKELAYGTVMCLTANEVAALYGGEGLQAYRPVKVQVTLLNGVNTDALCYLLPVDQLSGSNSAYAAQLAQVAKRLHFPAGYIQSIETWVE